MQKVDKERPAPLNMGEVNFSQAEDVRLETTRARFSNILKRHGNLTERLSRDSDKSIFERLQREFEAAHASQTQEVCIDGEQWNDGLLATIRERVHMEAERKAMQSQGDSAAMPNLPFYEKVTYRIGNKMICCLDGARIGIQYETSYAGEPCEVFHCVLESKSFLEKMTVLEHTIPFFLPIREAENEYLSLNAMKFIDHMGDLLQAYVDRREQVGTNIGDGRMGSLHHFSGEIGSLASGTENCDPCWSFKHDHPMRALQFTLQGPQELGSTGNVVGINGPRTTVFIVSVTGKVIFHQVRLIKELYGNQMGELYCSLTYHMVEFVLADFDCKVTVSLGYTDLVSTLPSEISVLAWPLQQPKRLRTGVAPNSRREVFGHQLLPARLSHAEDALRTLSLPQAFAEIVLSMPEALKEVFRE